MSNSAIAVRRGVDELGRAKEDPWRPSRSIVCNAFQGCPEENRPAADESILVLTIARSSRGGSQRKSGGCQYSLDLKYRQNADGSPLPIRNRDRGLGGVVIRAKMARFSCFYSHRYLHSPALNGLRDVATARARVRERRSGWSFQKGMGCGTVFSGRIARCQNSGRAVLHSPVTAKRYATTPISWRNDLGVRTFTP